MTTIAFRNGFLAADTRAYSGSAQPMGHKQKIFLIDEGSTFGVSTPHPGLSEEIKKWFLECKNFDQEPQLNGREFDILEIDAEGRIFFYHNNFVPSGPLTGEYFAIGSGAEYALGAMAMGASAAEAVQAASVHDAWTGQHIQQILVPAYRHLHELREGTEEDVEKVINEGEAA